MKLQIELDVEPVAPGHELTGRVLAVEGGRSRSLTLTVSFRERSPAYLETPFSASGVVHEGDLATGQAIPFRFTMPAEALPSAKGKHGELFWELAAVSNEPGLDTRTSRVFEVALGRRS